MKIDRLFSREVRLEMKSAIADAGGREVFFTGKIDDDGCVISVKAMARGTDDTVLVHKAAVRECSVLIHNHPGGDLTPSDADMMVASDCSENAQGFYIINNSASDVYVVVEPILPRKIKPLDIEDTAFYISDGGPLSKQSENFEMRPVQVDLLRNIVKTFNENGIGVFEAGTGVGKSYAYLVPSILWASTNKERVVISTGTINLQQQLCEKDIPAALKITGKKLKAILLKGRQNYVCKRRLQGALADRDLFSDDADTVAKIYEWASTSVSGSRSDLSFVPGENAWSRVKSESDACMGMRCPFFGECFVMKTRKEAADAQIIVVNHHLLFADIESRLSGAGYDDAAVLPPYRRLIFDEAHGIENAATSFFSESTNRFQIMKNINQLYRKRRTGSTGHIVTLAILANSDEEKENEISNTVDRIKSDIEKLETSSFDLLEGDYNFRISEKTGRAANPMLSLVATLAASVANFVAACREILEDLADEDKTIDAYWETRLSLRRLDETVKVLNDFGKWDEMHDTVFWLQRKTLSADAALRIASAAQSERSARSGKNAIVGRTAANGKNSYSERADGSQNQNAFVIFNETPLDISGRMNAGVFEPMSSVVCASATLTINRSFDYWMRRTGVHFADEERLDTCEYVSPFPYEKNMIFAVPSDAPMPERSVEFEQFVCAAVPALISASDGKTLVLFTSYESLKNTFRASQSALRSQYDFSGTLLKQGDDDNARLLDTFRNDESSVLFATDSFWQGVDVPGKSLSQVIIVKLPFPVPSDPVFAARSEAIERRGGSSFMELSVPEAVVKFRQGVGRLVRRSDDRGAVVLLDKRVYEKRYGAFFLNSIPKSKRVYEPLERIIERVSDLIFS